jgi:DNA-binding CsgD family transcriptional regulator
VIATLTRRERDVARLTSYGHSDKTIAHLLRCGRETVRTHQKNIRAKTGATNRIQVAVLWALDHEKETTTDADHT